MSLGGLSAEQGGGATAAGAAGISRRTVDRCSGPLSMTRKGCPGGRTAEACGAKGSASLFNSVPILSRSARISLDAAVLGRSRRPFNGDAGKSGVRTRAVGPRGTSSNLTPGSGERRAGRMARCGSRAGRTARGSSRASSPIALFMEARRSSIFGSAVTFCTLLVAYRIREKAEARIPQMRKRRKRRVTVIPVF